MCRATIVLACVLLLAITQTASFAQKNKEDTKGADESLSQLVEKHFAHWDTDKNQSLDLLEIDHVVADHSIHRRQAALIVNLRYYVTDKNHAPTLTHKDLIKLVETPEFAKKVDKSLNQLDKIDRELFLPKDPDLATFNQGRLNDCYFLSPVAAMAHRNGKSIRELIHPEVTGGFQVHFGDGQKIHISPLTDCELLLGARLDDRHGSWLIVLEKAYGVVRKREKSKKGEKPEKGIGSEPIRTLDWGDSQPIIAMLTGHHAEKLKLAKSTNDQVHTLLSDVTKKRHLACVGKGESQKIPGLVDRHVYAIMGYDARDRHVVIFNPWGNNFTPRGSAGKEHGYPTKNGQFTVPLDEFRTIFRDVIYETDRPLEK